MYLNFVTTRIFLSLVIRIRETDGSCTYFLMQNGNFHSLYFFKNLRKFTIQKMFTRNKKYIVRNFIDVNNFIPLCINYRTTIFVFRHVIKMTLTEPCASLVSSYVRNNNYNNFPLKSVVEIWQKLLRLFFS